LTLAGLLGRLLGLENVKSVDQLDASFAAPWANRAPVMVLFGCVALAALAFWFYARYQSRARRSARIALSVVRAAVLCLLLLILADPVLTMRLTSNPRPLLYVLFDGTDSMAITDEMTEVQRKELADSVGFRSKSGKAEKLTRAAYVQTLVEGDDAAQRLSPLVELNEKFRVKAFLLDRHDGVRALKLSDTSDGEIDPAFVAKQLTTEGQVTALGTALDDLAVRHSTGHLAGLVVFSDFAWNSGPAPVGSAAAPVGKLGVPVYTVGIGPAAAADLSVSISAKPVMKKAEKDTVMVVLRQQELLGRSATVRLIARQIPSGDVLTPASEPKDLGERTVELVGPTTSVEFPYTPDETGRFELVAEVEPFEEEVIDENNKSTREINVRDDFLRLLYVAYEPNWEWRFVKEVFQRDKLVGMRGFRTFLRSSDPKVRRSNPLFVPTLTPQRNEFFANDVIFLGDMPGEALSTRFCEMTAEFVKTFGGGLVVLAGPRFGPQQLEGTALADILPVVVDAGSELRDSQPFRMRRTADAEQYGFMQLGGSEVENEKAWQTMGELPWYQPIAKPHPLAVTLAEHPTNTCVDGKTPQPLIAVRQFEGGGKVVYVAFDETWRLRRKYGEQYYRQFWGQMIYDLGLRRALGSQKRFVVSTDRQQYQADDQVTVSVEAFDENFEALAADQLPEKYLEGELIVPLEGGASETHPVRIPYSREGQFVAHIPVLEAGEHRLRVRDPVTREYSEVLFQVTSVSAERQSAVRNVALQREIALASGGKSFEMSALPKLTDEIEATTITEVSTKVFRLWSTWLCFGLVVLLLIGEWAARKWVNLP
jgi:hypothetical protein